MIPIGLGPGFLKGPSPAPCIGVDEGPILDMPNTFADDFQLNNRILGCEGGLGEV